MSITSIIKGRQRRPRRIVMYGTQGIGKTTWAAQAPKPIFIATEEGSLDIDVDRFPTCKSYTDVMHCMKTLATEEHGYSTLVLDTADWLERMIWSDVAAQAKVTSIEDIPYGKGYKYATSWWRKVFQGLEIIRGQGMHTIVLAHAHVEKFAPPGQETFDRFAPKLHKEAGPLMMEWADEVLFATFPIYTGKEDQGFGKKRTFAQRAGDRQMYTASDASHVAKNRLGLPPKLPLLWAELEPYIAGLAIPSETPEPEQAAAPDPAPSPTAPEQDGWITAPTIAPPPAEAKAALDADEQAEIEEQEADRREAAKK